MVRRTARQRLRLALLRAFAHLTRARQAQESRLSPDEQDRQLPRRILVIRPDHLGDLLFTTPALRALRKRYPRAHISALVGPWGAPVLARNRAVDEILTLAYPGFSRQRKPASWQPYALLYEWARHLRGGGYDLAIVQRFDHWWGALLAYLAGIPQRVGYAVPEVAPFLTHALLYEAGRHEVCQNLRLVEGHLGNSNAHGGEPGAAAGLPAPCSVAEHPLAFHVPEHAASWARDTLAPGPHIAVHPGAGAPVKLWLAERWAQVADALSAETGSPILLTGSAAERALCGEIAAHMKTEPRVMAGETRLDQLAALFGRCRLVLGPDSGPMHLAVAVGTPTIHLYGPADTATFGPWGARERHRVLVSAWPCIPCNRLDYRPAELAHHPCVREIDVAAVLAAARELLAGY